MEYTTTSHQSRQSHSIKTNILHYKLKAHTLKSKNIAKKPRQIERESCESSWPKSHKLLLVRHLLRAVSHNQLVQKCFYENISRLIRKSPKNVYNFHLKLLSIYKSNQNIISSMLGDQFIRQKYLKLRKTHSHHDFLQFDFDKEVLQREHSQQFDSFVSSELNFIQALSLLQKTPDCDFDHLQSIEMIQGDFDSINQDILYEDIEIQCE